MMKTKERKEYCECKEKTDTYKNKEKQVICLKCLKKVANLKNNVRLL